MARPSKYKPEFCQMLIQHSSAGHSFESFAALVGVSRDTLYSWEEKIPEFSDTKKRAWALSLYFWEQEGLKGLWGKGNFNSSVWIFNMKCRFGWRDTHQNQLQEQQEIVIKVDKQDLNL